MHMELPLGTEGRKATHDFLSLYSPSSAHARQQDPAPPTGAHLKTHDFLQPLERDGKHGASTKEDEYRGGGMSAAAKPPMPSPPVSADHLLPNCVGAYSISYFHQGAPKPERSLFTASQACSTTQTDENSNCSSYTGSGFTLWDESVDKKGKTGKENVAMERHAWGESCGNVVGAQWTPLLERPSASASPSPPPSFHKPNPTTFSSFSSSQLSSSQNDQSFIEMITSAKNEQEEDDDDDESKFIIRKGISSHPEGNLSDKVESKAVDQKPSTSRSKHSATEQRRRSKINDRFQKLREVIPNSDQKRDKASFLLQVVEYIQFLQEKVNRFESSWSHKSSKMIQWRNCHLAEGFINHKGGANKETGSAKLVAAKNKANISPSNLMDSDMSSATTLKERGQQPGLTSIPKPFHPTAQQSTITFGQASPATSPVPQQYQVSNTDKTVAQSPSQAQQNRLYTANCTGTGQETTIDSGTINISRTYSQGLLNTLTKALRTSGVDLSQACISVKINLGKGACAGIPHPSSSTAKDVEILEALPHFKAGSLADRALKRLRTS